MYDMYFIVIEKLIYEYVFIVKISLITWYEKIIGNPAQLQNDKWFSIVS